MELLVDIKYIKKADWVFPEFDSSIPYLNVHQAYENRFQFDS